MHSSKTCVEDSDCTDIPFIMIEERTEDILYVAARKRY